MSLNEVIALLLLKTRLTTSHNPANRTSRLGQSTAQGSLTRYARRCVQATGCGAPAPTPADTAHGIVRLVRVKRHADHGTLSCVLRADPDLADPDLAHEKQVTVPKMEWPVHGQIKTIALLKKSNGRPWAAFRSHRSWVSQRLDQPSPLPCGARTRYSVATGR